MSCSRLLVDPQYRKEHLTKFDEPSSNFCGAVGCAVKVEIVDLANHTRLGGFEVPSAARAADGAPSFAVSRFGDRVYIGEQLAEEVQAFSAGGMLLGSVPAGAGTGGPIDMVPSRSDSSLFVLDRRGISRIDAMTMTNIGRWNAPDEAVQRGVFPRLAVSPNGAKLVTTAWLSSGPHVYIVTSADMTLETLAPIDPVTSYVVSWSWTSDPHESRRLAVVHTPTGTLTDSVYFFPSSPGNALPPRIMDVQIVRKVVAGDVAPPARQRP